MEMGLARPQILNIEDPHYAPPISEAKPAPATVTRTFYTRLFLYGMNAYVLSVVPIESWHFKTRS